MSSFSENIRKYPIRLKVNVLIRNNFSPVPKFRETNFFFEFRIVHFRELVAPENISYITLC